MMIVAAGRPVNRWAGTALRALAVVLAVVAGACRGGPPARRAGATPVRVMPVKRIDAPVTVSASGVVEPMQTVSVTAQVSGTLLDVLFKEGDFVQKGQQLFRLDPRPLQAIVDQAQATLTKDIANANAAESDDARYKSLAGIGYVSRSQSDQMHAAALASAATVQADRAALRAARVNLGFTAIAAPIGGRTGSLIVRRGNNVGPTTGPLVVINQISPVLVRFPVLQQDFPSMQAAVARRPLLVTAASTDSAREVERGQLTFLDNNVDSLTGTVTGKANFANADRGLWPGELVFLTVQLRVQHGVLAVPTDAILTGQQGPYVFVIDASNTANMRQISPGLQVADLTVIQKGLGVGERVVVDGQSRLDQGTRVAITGFGTDTGTATLGKQVDSSATAPAESVGGEVGAVARPGSVNPAPAARGARAGPGAVPGTAGGAPPPTPSPRGASPSSTPSTGNASPSTATPSSTPTPTLPSVTPSSPTPPGMTRPSTTPSTSPPANGRTTGRPPAPTSTGRPPP
ncbi:MAG TPA: efflux RND transporter periplasmic adaptor subunit [Gemmatimonadaceae bacterium]|nr:efflux RND transporter periplasmic adaptor subunit [Gemmatimonadaceae bacterium]